MSFIVRNAHAASFILNDTWLYQEFAPGEGGVDLEQLFSHEQLYYSSQPTNGLWSAIQNGDLIRRSDDNTMDIPVELAFYDAIWRYAPNEGQWEALRGTYETPSDINRYVTELDFGVGSTVNTVGATPATLYSVPVPPNCVMLLQVWATAARTGGTSGVVGDGANLVRIGSVKNVAGALTIKVTESAYTFRDQPSWRVYFEAAGTNCIVRVQGAVGNNVAWTGKTRWQIQKF